MFLSPPPERLRVNKRRRAAAAFSVAACMMFFRISSVSFHFEVIHDAIGFFGSKVVSSFRWDVRAWSCSCAVSFDTRSASDPAVLMYV